MADSHDLLKIFLKESFLALSETSINMPAGLPKSKPPPTEQGQSKHKSTYDGAVSSTPTEPPKYQVEGGAIHFGSSEHVALYDEVLTKLKNIRKNLRKVDRKERDRITRCMESIRDLRKRARKHGLTTGLIEEQD